MSDDKRPECLPTKLWKGQNMTRANSGLMCFISVFVIGATVFSGVKAENISAVVPGTGSDTSSDTARHEVDTVMQKFAVYKNNQTEEIYVLA